MALILVHSSQMDLGIGPRAIIPSLSQVEAEFSGNDLLQSREEAKKALQPWEEENLGLRACLDADAKETKGHEESEDENSNQEFQSNGGNNGDESAFEFPSFMNNLSTPSLPDFVSKSQPRALSLDKSWDNDHDLGDMLGELDDEREDCGEEVTKNDGDQRGRDVLVSSSYPGALRLPEELIHAQICAGGGAIIPSMSQMDADFCGEGLIQSGEGAEDGLQPWEKKDEEQGTNVNFLAEPKAQTLDWEISYEEFIAGIGASSCNRFPSLPTRMADSEGPDFFETWDKGELPEEDIAMIVEAVGSSPVPWCQDLWDASSLPDSEVSLGSGSSEEQEEEPENGGVDPEDWGCSEEDHLAAQRHWTEARHARRQAREAEALKKANSSGMQPQVQGSPAAQASPKLEAARVGESRAITQPNEQVLEHHTTSPRPPNRSTSGWTPTTNDLAGGRRKLNVQPAISTSPNENTTHRPRRHGRPAIPGLVLTSPELAGALGDLRSTPIAEGPTVPRFELPKVQLRKIALTNPISTTPTTTPPAFNLPRVQLRPVFGRAEGRVNEARGSSGGVASSVRYSFCLTVS